MVHKGKVCEVNLSRCLTFLWTIFVPLNKIDSVSGVLYFWVKVANQWREIGYLRSQLFREIIAVFLIRMALKLNFSISR